MQTPVFENKWTPANIVQIGVLVVGLTGFGISLQSGLGTLVEKVQNLSSELRYVNEQWTARFNAFDLRLRTLEMEGALRERRIMELESDVELLNKGENR